jgi:precorrin-6y C5,15-methyltransferase (decarboxylating) CbiE subunit
MAIEGRKIAVVGCGPGSADFLTAAGLRAIRSAEVLVGTPRLLDLLPEGGQERIAVGADIGKALDDIAARWPTRSVAVLVTGDPGLCSLAKPILRRFGRDSCDIVPGISSVQMAFARVGLDWLEARILSAHDQLPALSPGDLAGHDKIAILAGRQESLRWVADLADVLGEGHAIYVCEDLTLENELVQRMTPGDLRTLKASTRTVVLLIKESLLP